MSCAAPAALPPGGATEIRGAQRVAEEVRFSQRRARFAEPVLVDGQLGAVVAPRGRLIFALTFTVENEKITVVTVIAGPECLRHLPLALLD